MLFASAGNPLPQEENVVSAGFLKSAFPKAVRLLNEADIVLRRKALLTISVMIPPLFQFDPSLGSFYENLSITSYNNVVVPYK